MIVTVHGRRDGSGRGEATEIEFRHQLHGTVDDRGAGHVVVAGAVVSIDDSTEIVDHHGGRLGPDDLSTGRRVEVSGHADARGGIRATSIRERDDSAELEREIRAYVVAVSGGVVDLAFSKGGPVAVRVDVSGLSPAPSVSVGDLVEVKTRGTEGAPGVLVATALHREDDHGRGTGDEWELEGIVTSGDSAAFTVAGQRVETSGATVYVGGTADDVVPGAKVEAEGSLRADGVLAARKVALKPVVRVEANAGAIDVAAGTVSVLGLAVHVTPSTELNGLSSLAEIASGAEIEVRGTARRDGGGIDATRIDFVDGSSSDRATLRGVVSAKTPTSGLTILGLPIVVAGAEFRSMADQPLSPSAFFDAITAGQTIVKVRWRPYPTTTAAAVDEAELEN
jgi:hypothetical protein